MPSVSVAFLLLWSVIKTHIFIVIGILSVIMQSVMAPLSSPRTHDSKCIEQYKTTWRRYRIKYGCKKGFTKQTLEDYTAKIFIVS